MTEQQRITIDGTEYTLADLSDEAKQQLNNLRATDTEIQRMQSQLAMIQTARAAYAKALGDALPKKKPTTRKRTPKKTV